MALAAIQVSVYISLRFGLHTASACELASQVGKRRFSGECNETEAGRTKRERETKQKQTNSKRPIYSRNYSHVVLDASDAIDFQKASKDQVAIVLRLNNFYLPAYVYVWP